MPGLPAWMGEEMRELSCVTCLPTGTAEGLGDGRFRFLFVSLREGTGKLLINWSKAECLRKERRIYGAQGTGTKWMAHLQVNMDPR